MSTQRIFSILAAAFFVTAVGLATASPKMQDLAAVAGWFMPGGVEGFHRWLDRSMGQWWWTWVAQPLLDRPAWMPFVDLGLICTAAALSLKPRDATRRSHRRG